MIAMRHADAYLHVGEPRTSKVRERPSFAATAQIVLLDASGRKVREWIGIVAESTPATGLEDLLRR